MTNLNRWLIPIGLGVFVSMLVIAAFSLGVFVGERGWTRGGLQNNAPMGLPPGAQGPQGPGQTGPGGAHPQGAGLPQGRPQLIGRVLRISEESLELITQEGRRQVNLSSDTGYQNVEGTTLRLEDLTTEDVVVVFGKFTGGDGSQLEAEVVVKLPPKKD